MELLHCPCCHEQSLEIRFDKNQRPYSVCDSCGTKIFGRGIRALIGLHLASDVIGALAERTRSDVAAWERAREVRARVERTYGGLHARTAEPVAATAAEPVAAAGGAR